MIFPRSVWHASLVDLAALLKLQWLFPPASSLMKYYHLHSVKFGKTTEGINDSHWIKQQLRKRKHSSLENWITWLPGTFQTGRCFWTPLSMGLGKSVSQGSASLFPHLKIVPMQCQDAFLDEFQGAEDLLTPPLAQRLAPHHRCLPASLCDSVSARWPCLDGWLNYRIDLNWLPAFEILEHTEQPYHFYLLST